MVKFHLMYNWYSFSDPANEDALMQIATMCFAGIDLISDKISNETTIFSFRHLLEKNKLGNEIFDVVKAHLKHRGMAMKQGMIIVATLISAPVSTKK